jgi:nitrogen fixation/metabolism regulation signal transduction histidine kinase
MKSAIAKVENDVTALEDLGRATLQIVHDLKNQLNGLKLYATYLRKRLEREDRTPEERETLAKLIVGLDRAAKDMSALVRYAQPVELRRQPRTDLEKIISDLVHDLGTRETGGLPPITIATHFDDAELFGEFDAIALTQAVNEITDDVRNSIKSKEPPQLSLYVRREQNAGNPEAVIEWRGANRIARNNSFNSSIACGTVHTALGAKIIEAHGGRIQCDADAVRVWLPLIN